MAWDAPDADTDRLVWDRRRKPKPQTRENREVNTRAGDGTCPLGLVTMLLDCGCAEHKTVLKGVSGCLRARKERNTERAGLCFMFEFNTGLIARDWCWISWTCEVHFYVDVTFHHRIKEKQDILRKLRLFGTIQIICFLDNLAQISKYFWLSYVSGFDSFLTRGESLWIHRKYNHRQQHTHTKKKQRKAKHTRRSAPLSKTNTSTRYTTLQ